VSNKQDLLLRLDSEFNDKGFKKAEDSARVLERELAKQEAAQRSLANMQMAAMREQQRMDQARLTSMTAVGKGFTAVGLLAAAGLGLATKAAMDWETAWAGVTKTVNGSPEEMAALEVELRKLAKTLPATHEEIAAVAEAAGQLGVRRQDIAAFTKTMIDLGVSTNLTADEAATGIAQISNVMGTLEREGTQGISRFASVLVALGNAGASTEKDILEMAARIAGAGKLVGATEGEVLALSNAMSSLGIEAQLGGGVMTRTMITINSAVKEGGDRLDKFAKVSGVSADVFAQKWASDPVQAIDMFIKGLSRVNASGGDAAGTLKDLGLRGTENAQVLLRMTGAGNLLSDSLALQATSWEQNVAALNEANKRYETTASRAKIARNELNDAAIDIGANVLPVLAGLADRVGFLAEAFHALPGPVKEAVTILGGIVMTVGLVGGAALILIPKLAAMNATLAASGPAGARAAAGLSAAGKAMMGPWGLAMAGATIALGVFAEKQFEAKQKSDEFRGSLDQTTGALTDQSRVLMAQSLQQSGVADAYAGLVGGLKNLTEAALGNEEVLARLHEQQKANEDIVTRLAAKHGDLTASEYEELDAATQRSTAYDNLFKKLGPLNDATAAQMQQQKELGSVTEGSTASTNDFAEAQKTAQQETENTAKEVEDLIRSVENYGDSLNAALDATSAYEAALDDASAALKENGKTANKTRTAIDLNTKAGRDNDKALRAIATSALKAATANFENGRSVKSVTGDVMKARSEFVTMATKMGLSRAAAEKLATQLGLTKGNVSSLSEAITKTPTSHSTKMDVETKAALAKLAAFQQRINQLRGNDVRITTRYVTVGQKPGGGVNKGGGTTKDAAGSIHEFAGGGFAPIGIQQPQIRLAGGAGMTWAEKGAGPWEAFISGNPANQKRSEDIWWETGRRLGTVAAAQSAAPVIVRMQPNIDRSLTVKAYGPSAREVMREAKKVQKQDEALHPIWGS
jgi:TP901 family phage tail tape measure protein